MTMVTSASPGRRRDDDLAGAGRQVRGGGVALGEAAGRLDDDVGAERLPGQFRRDRSRCMTLMALPSTTSVSPSNAHLARPDAVDRVVLEQVAHGGAVHEVVDADDVDVGAALERRAQIQTADAAEPVDSNPGAHATSPSIAAQLTKSAAATAGLAALHTAWRTGVRARGAPPTARPARPPVR